MGQHWLAFRAPAHPPGRSAPLSEADARPPYRVPRGTSAIGDGLSCRSTDRRRVAPGSGSVACQSSGGATSDGMSGPEGPRNRKMNPPGRTKAARHADPVGGLTVFHVEHRPRGRQFPQKHEPPVSRVEQRQRRVPLERRRNGRRDIRTGGAAEQEDEPAGPDEGLQPHEHPLLHPDGPHGHHVRGFVQVRPGEEFLVTGVPLRGTPCPAGPERGGGRRDRARRPVAARARPVAGLRQARRVHLPVPRAVRSRRSLHRGPAAGVAFDAPPAGRDARAAGAAP